jgi:hypothetical protein
MLFLIDRFAASREPFDLSQSRNSSQDKSPVEIKTEIPSPVNREPENTHLKQEADDSENNNKSSPAVNGCKSVDSSPSQHNINHSNGRSVSDWQTVITVRAALTLSFLQIKGTISVVLTRSSSVCCSCIFEPIYYIGQV